MKPESYELLDAIVTGAMDLSVDARAEFIRGRCAGDENLRREAVDALARTLAMMHDPFLELPPVRISEEPAADSVEGYEILGCVGDGGQGRVYRARGGGALRKDAAVKIVRSGQRTEEILRRFRQEVRIYETLGEHPNIARVDGAGRTRDGRPYFVMEFITGSRIDEYCDERRLGLRDRARLVVEICEALKHAHGQLVIHRDLKPHNILVTPEGVPKVLDFGIAKLLDDGNEGIETGQTWTLHQPFTPQYACPEQVRGEPLSVAADVYSLGVVLYELLTGRRPLKVAGLNRAELIRAVCEIEPPAPDQAALDGREDPKPESIAGLRSSTPRQLARDLSGDLRTILRHAMHKDPLRRYKSMGEFAADLRAWIAGEPLRYARKPGRIERAIYWARRNRPLVGGLAAVAVFAPLLLSAWVAGLESEARRAAEHKARREEALANAEYDAVLVASILETALDRLRQTVDRAADADDLAPMISARDTTALKTRVDDLARTGGTDPEAGGLIESWAVYDAAGIMLAHSTTGEHVGGDFSHRDYIRGALADVPDDGKPAAYVSRMYFSQTQKFHKFSIARAVRAGGATGPVVGVITNSYSTGRTLGVPHIEDARYKVVLVGRWDPNPLPGEPIPGSDHLIVLHPSFPDAGERRGAKPADPVPFPRQLAPLLSGGRSERYLDPAGSLHPEYGGEWLAASAPVRGSEFVVIVQVREPKVAPEDATR